MHTVRATSLLKGALPTRGAQTAFRFPRLSQFRYMASIANEMTQSPSTTQRPAMATRQLTTTYAAIATHRIVTAANCLYRSGDFCTTNSPDVRKHLGTYGLTPPAVESFDVQAQRCLRLLAMKTTPIEKFQYLVHLKASNVHLFYRLLSQNIKV